MKQEIQQRIDEIKRGIIPKGYNKGKLCIVCADWEEVPFFTLFTSTNIYTDDLEKYPLYSLTIEDGITAKTERYERSHLVKKEEAYKVVRPNDYAYNPMNIRFGAVARHKGSFPVAVSGYYDIFTTVHPEDLPFMDSFLTCSSMITYYNKVATGSLVEKQRVHFSQFMDFSLALPPLEERKRIADILVTQDKVIELYERKIEQFKRFKKACLRRMFPKGKSKIPEVRFPGFTEPWEMHRFKDFTWAAGKRNRENLDLEPYAITNEHGFIPQNKAHDEFGYMKDTDRKAYNIVEPYSFAYNPARINVGSIGYYAGFENVIVSSLYEVFKTVDYVDDKFLWHWFKSDELPKWIERLQEGSVRMYFYYDKLCECQILMPSLPEQKKISLFFDNLDSYIALYQRKRDKEKQKKKALMQLLLTGIVRVKE